MKPARARTEEEIQRDEGAALAYERARYYAAHPNAVVWIRLADGQWKEETRP